MSGSWFFPKAFGSLSWQLAVSERQAVVAKAIWKQKCSGALMLQERISAEVVPFADGAGFALTAHLWKEKLGGL